MITRRNERIGLWIGPAIVALLLILGLTASGAYADKDTGSQSANSALPSSQSGPQGDGVGVGQSVQPASSVQQSGNTDADAVIPVIDDFDKLPPGMKARSMSGLINAGMVHPFERKVGPGQANKLAADSPLSTITWGTQQNMANVAGSNEPAASMHPYNGLWALSGGNSNNFNSTTNGGATWSRDAVPACTSGGDDVPVWLAGNVNNANSALGISLCTSGADWDIPLSISTNAGTTWAATGTTAGVPGFDDDREYLWVDYNPNSPFYGRAYVTDALFDAGGTGSYDTVGVRASTNQGATWTSFVPLVRADEFATGTNHNEFPSLAIEPDGTVVAAWHRGRCCGIITTVTNKVMWSRSTDGGVTFPISGTIVTVPNNQSVEFNSTSPGGFRWSDTPNIAADPVERHAKHRGGPGGRHALRSVGARAHS